jgi:hypothetical protein
MEIIRIPQDIEDDWESVSEQQPCTRWLEDENVPYDSPENAVLYFKKINEPNLKLIVEQKDYLPQSFIHWWCYNRHVYLNDLDEELPLYPSIRKWLPIIHLWLNKDDVSEVDIFGTFKIWLDILFVDITVREKDENIRNKVPRLMENMNMDDFNTLTGNRYNNDLVQFMFENNDGYIIGWNFNTNQVRPNIKIQSRYTTMKYIINEGQRIFKERGWKEGIEYWKKETKKYLIFT